MNQLEYPLLNLTLAQAQLALEQLPCVESLSRPAWVRRGHQPLLRLLEESLEAHSPVLVYPEDLVSRTDLLHRQLSLLLALLAQPDMQMELTTRQLLPRRLRAERGRELALMLQRDHLLADLLLLDLD